MLAAKAGREDQLRVLEKYLAGEEVAFKSHQGKDFETTYDPTVWDKPVCDPKITFDKQAIFLDAATQCDEATVVQLLDDGFDPNTANPDGLTALHQCAIEGSVKVTSLLVNRGANANAIDNDWWTPLHAAAACDHWRVVNSLIASNAQVDVVNVDGDLPLDLAEGDKTRQILESEMQVLGLDEEARARIRGRDELTFTAKAKLWVEDQTDLNFRGRCNETPLHIAASNGWVDACQCLVDAGADLSAQDEDGDTPLHLAAFFEQYKIVEILGAAGAKVGMMNRFMQTPLVMSEDATMIRLIKAIGQNQKVSRDGGDETSRRRGRSGSSVKRKSYADKGNLRKEDARRMMQAAAEYAEANVDDDSKGKVVYTSGGDPSSPGVVEATPALYAVPNKLPSTTAKEEPVARQSKKEKKASKKKEAKESKRQKRLSKVNANVDKTGSCTLS